jgi:hypothetical protein
MKFKKRGDEIKKKSSFQQSFVEIGSVVSEEKIIFLISSPLFSNLHNRSKSAKVLSLEISSNGQNCSILSQKVPKFELYKHNDELFNIYYGFFMNFELLPILSDYVN